MIMQTKIVFVASALAAGAVFAGTAVAAVVNQPIAREAGEIRGEGKGHPAIEIKDQLARQGADDPDEDIGDDHGGRHSSASSVDQLARQGADDPDEDIGDDHGGGRNHG